MRASASRVFRALLGEAIHDAIRRRIVPAIAVVSLLSLMMVDSCTSCAAAPAIVQNGVSVEVPDVAGWTGMMIFALLALWTMVLAGVLASDHLAEVLADGTAPLVLSRPVSRASFALARLGGVLVIALVTGMVLLGGTGALLVIRNDVTIGAAIWAGLACALGATITASLAMSASLYLPRIATVMVVLVGVGMIATVNAIGLFRVELGGVAWAIDRFGPPLGTSVVTALSPWIAPAVVSSDPLEVSVRAVAWAVAGVALLVVAFRKQDIGK
jgi:hypothetical protein